MKGGRHAGGSSQKPLDLWNPPESAGEPRVCLATSYTFNAAFFETECVGRFLAFDNHPSESDAVAYLIEREEKLAASQVIALVDRRQATEKESFRWDVLGVAVPRAIQHAKVSLLVWANHVRVIIGSGNLTLSGYRSNLEVFGSIEFGKVDGGDRSAVLETLDFLDTVILYSVGSSDAATPRGRATSAVRDVRQLVRRWEDTGRDRMSPVPIFGRPRAPVLDQLGAAWAGPGRARTAEVLSPFFDQSSNDGEPLTALNGLLAKTGDRSINLHVREDEVADGSRRIFAPRPLIDHGLELVPEFNVHGVERLQNGEWRDLHAKMVMLHNDEALLLMIGSSNFTRNGMGAATSTPNLEANVAYSARLGDAHHDTMWNLWPDHGDAIDLSSEDLHWDPLTEADEEAGNAPMLPAAFQEALFQGGADARLIVTLGEKLPESWSIATDDGPRLLSHDLEGAGTHRIPWATNPPFVLTVRWGNAEAEFTASWPVNAADPSCLPVPELLRDLTFDELLAILASTRPLSAATAAVLERRKKKMASGDRDELDPLRRFQPATLLRRAKRVAAALDRLRERLERPALTREAMEWRLKGPVGPRALVEALRDEKYFPGECEFYMAELALCLRRVDAARVAAGGIPVSAVRALLTDAIQEISQAATLPATSDKTMLRSYVASAFEEALS